MTKRPLQPYSELERWGEMIHGGPALGERVNDDRSGRAASAPYGVHIRLKRFETCRIAMSLGSTGTRRNSTTSRIARTN